MANEIKLKKWNGSAWVQQYPEVRHTDIVASGTPSSSNFLRGDGAWANVGDGNTKFYAWRAINNTSSGGAGYYRIANINGQASTRFQIEITGRSQGYGDGNLPNYAKILGQYNNDNNYDVWFFNNRTGTSEVVEEVGTVDDGTNNVNIWVKVSSFAEVTATAYISDGTITTYDTNSLTTSAPTGYSAVGAEYIMWNSGNDGSGSGLDADTVDGLQASQFIRSDSTDSASGNLTFGGTTTFNNQVTIDTGTSSNALYLKGTSPTITFADDTSGADDFFLHANGNNFYILTDRDGGDQVGAGYETPHPLQLEADTNVGYLFGEVIASRNYVDTEIASLVASAPDALNTLNELASALGDDANFSTTVTNSLAGKLNLTGGTLTGTLTSRAINMQNYNLTGVNMLQFNDAGPNEGIDWSGGNFKIYESPDDLTTNSAGNLQFVSGGQRRMTVGTDGYVYVGSTLHAPTSVTTAKTHITASNPILQLTDSDTSGSAYIDYQGGTSLKVHAGSDPIVFIAGNSEKARLTAGNGNLGIGTTNPSQKLDVAGNIKLQNNGNLYLFNTDNYIKYNYWRVNTGGNVNIFNQGNSDIVLSTNNDEKMRIKADGKVGIGTTSPTAVLDVNGALNLKGRAFGDSDGTNSYFKAGTSGSIFFETNGGTRGKIDTSGNFGIGTLSPSEKLQVDGNIKLNSTLPKIQFTDTDNDSDFHIANNNGVLEIADTSNQEERFAITTAGNVGIGTTSPTQKLEVDGNINANELHLNDTNTIVKEGNANSVKIQTNSGYVDIGPQNTGFSHFNTDRGRFYFNKGADFDGDIRAYSNPTTKIEESTGHIFELGERVATQDFVENASGYWKQIKTGSTTITSGTTSTSITVDETLLNQGGQDQLVIAFELNTNGVANTTSEVHIVKLENSSSSAGGILFNASASNASIQVGSIRVYRGLASTQLTFSYSYKFTNGSSSEIPDTVYVGRVWKLVGVEGV